MKINVFYLALLSALPAHASMDSYVVNGTPLNWAEHDNIVRIDGHGRYCSGSIIAGRFVLTAAHCTGFARQFSNGDVVTPVIDSLDHPNYIGVGGSFNSEDIGLLIARTPIGYEKIHFLDIDDFTQREKVSVLGFGGTRTTLEKADFLYSHARSEYPFAIHLDMKNESETTGGDSGGAWLNGGNKIVGVHKGAKVSGNDIDTYGTDLTYAADFILDTIDGWHYPTIARVDNKSTITVQSLHLNDVVDAAYVEGDITINIDESTCLNGVIEPFETCTYVVESEGGKGVLYLSADERIEVYPKESTPPDVEEVERSGASVGLWSLLLLSLFGLRRRK